MSDSFSHSLQMRHGMNSHSSTQNNELMKLDSRIVSLFIIDNISCLHLLIYLSHLISVIEIKLIVGLWRNYWFQMILQILKWETSRDQLEFDTHCNYRLHINSQIFLNSLMPSKHILSLNQTLQMNVQIKSF